MGKDLARIKDKEQALDSENRILRAKLLSSKKQQRKSDRASDYQKLASETEAARQNPPSTTYAPRSYTSLASSNLSADELILDEEPVKLVSAAATTAQADTPSANKGGASAQNSSF